MTLNQHLPDMNLKEIEESESERDENSDADDVLPLDFRTALIEEDNRVVIQAKPLAMKLEEDDDDKKDLSKSGLDGYLEMVRKEAFKEEEGAVMIDPDINIKEKFEEIDLPCNTVKRINNTIDAPIRPNTPTSSSDNKKKVNRGPKSNKTYDTDTGASNSEVEEHKQNIKKTTIKEQT